MKKHESWVHTYHKQKEEPGSGEACGGLVELEYDGVDLRSHDMRQPDGHRVRAEQEHSGECFHDAGYFLHRHGVMRTNSERWRMVVMVLCSDRRFRIGMETAAPFAAHSGLGN